MDELYDLASDPGELTNVAGAAAYCDRLHEMQQRLFNRLVEIGDPWSEEVGATFEM